MGKTEEIDVRRHGRDRPCSGSDRRSAWVAWLAVCRRRFVSPAIVAGLLGVGLLASSHAEAQTDGDAAAGRALAQRWCSSCHMVAVRQPSAQATGVPTFVGIARMPSTTSLSLRAFLQTPHVRMPDLNLTHEEISDVTAYILGLKGQ